jgi:hypothetical protein
VLKRICGAIDKVNLFDKVCGCDVENYTELLKVNSRDGKVHKCPACTRTNPQGSVVWRFLLGKDAIASVLATSLYQQIPPRIRKSKETSEDNDIGILYFMPYSKAPVRNLILIARI